MVKFATGLLVGAFGMSLCSLVALLKMQSRSEERHSELLIEYERSKAESEKAKVE